MSTPPADDPATDAPITEAAAEAAAIEAGRLMFARPWKFVLGAPDHRFLPPIGPIEVAFAGRSNVGKSSLINALVGQSGLARTSNTPGRTQELNFFRPEDETIGLVVVDMPGYGYAAAPKDKVDAWTRLVFGYLRGRPTLKRVYLLIDGRHGPKPNDAEVMDLLDRAAVSYQVVLTKADKPSAKELAEVVARTTAAIARRAAAHPEILTTSSEKGEGLERLRAEIATFAAG